MDKYKLQMAVKFKRDATRFSVCDATRMRMNRHECIHEYTVTNRATPCGRVTVPARTSEASLPHNG